MDKKFHNSRHKELFEKFQRKRQDYFMILGGASEEDVASFSLGSYKRTCSKSAYDFTEEDNKNEELIYENMSEDEKPLSCKYLEKEKLRNSRANLGDITNEPVFKALNGLQSRLEQIHAKQFEPYSGYPSKDRKIQEHENSQKYEIKLNSKQNFIQNIIENLLRRKPVEDMWEGATDITENRYLFLLENLVHKDEIKRKKFEEEFVSNIPTFSHEGFYFWPDK